MRVVARGSAGVRWTRGAFGKTIHGRWAGRVAVCAASGPTLNAEDLQRARAAGAAIIAVNGAYQLAPDADALYACDTAWWDQNIAAVRETFRGECWTQSKPAAENYALNYIECRECAEGRGLNMEAGYIFSGMNSGYQAIGLAVQFGARRIVLLGYNMQHVDGKVHFHGEHDPVNLRNPGPATLARFARQFSKMAVDAARFGVEIVNCTNPTALDCFPMAALEDTL